jgi:hypothetical protein
MGFRNSARVWVALPLFVLTASEDDAARELRLDDKAVAQMSP